MKTEMTPGPWKVGPSHVVSRQYQDGDKRITHWVAECVGMHSQETIEANARAISLVPDMVEALEDAQGYVTSNHDEGCELDDEYGEMAFDNRMDVEDPDGIGVSCYPKDAKCTCQATTLSSRIDTILSRINGEEG